MQVSGSKLQENFEYLDKKDGLPAGNKGDMLYNNGSKWVLLLNPGTPSTGYVWTLQHDVAAPEWVEYKEITVILCDGGTPTSYTILGIPTV